MNLMLGVIFGSILLGLLARGFGRHQVWVLVGIATLMTFLYWYSPVRFM